MAKGYPKNGVNKGWIKKGSKLPDYWVERMKGNKNHLGCKHSKETRKKMSDNHKGFLGLKHSKTTKNKLSGENSVCWKGDFAGYGSMHDWIRRKKGTPQKCELCGTRKKRRYHWVNKDHKYKRILNDYFRACVPCHKKYDKENN